MADNAALSKQVEALQQSLNDFRRDVNESFKTARRLQEDEERTLKARVASIGNQVAYLRDNVYHCLKGLVIQINAPGWMRARP